MSWLPSNDPILGDPRSCDALELVIVPRTRDLGDGFEVRRALPHGKRQMVGPFIFFDHFGPVQFIDRKSTRLNSSHEWISYAVFCLKKNRKPGSGLISGPCGGPTSDGAAVRGR